MAISNVLGILVLWSVAGIIIEFIAWLFVDFIDFEQGLNWLSPLYIYD